jgi:hypothetical protein
MKRSALVVIALVATAALLVPTMASSHFESDGTDNLNGTALVLEPAEGPNGKYAVLNEEDEIELLLTESNPNLEGDGVNPDTVTPIKRVFTITYRVAESSNYMGEGSVKVWITDDADDVHFFHGDDLGNSIEGSNNSVVLNESESIAVGILVDTRDPDHDVEEATTFSIHADRTEGSNTEDTPNVTNPTTTESTEETTQEDTTESVVSTSTPQPQTTEDTTKSNNPSALEQTKTGERTTYQATQTTGSAPGTRNTSERETKRAYAGSDTTARPVGVPIWSLVLIAGFLAGIRRRLRHA